MGKLLIWVGRFAAIAGVLLGAFSVLARLQGNFMVAGFQTGTLLLASIAAMVFGCLCYLVVLAERSGR